MMSRKKLKRLSAFSVYKERKVHSEQEQDGSTEAKKELRRRKRSGGKPPILDVHSEELKNDSITSSECSAAPIPAVGAPMPAVGGAKKRAKKRKRTAKVVSERKRSRREVAVQEAVETLSEEDSPSDKRKVQSSVPDVPFSALFKPDLYSSSEEAAKELFKLMIRPFPASSFFQEVWEQHPMVLQRQKPHYNDGWFSSQEVDSILREHHLEFSTNIDLTTYEAGKRETHNPVGRATASIVWEHFKAGCSVRLLNPQTFSDTVWLLNSTLQELFNSGVGANTYLTPAGSQGFSPHYDDIEAFVMQLEGRKKWKVYRPRNDTKYLPQFSSGNFSEADIGEPMLEVVLEPGDLLYFPRGFIHQACALPDTHSLHITVSTYHRNTWSDLLGKLLPAALEVATAEDLEFRAGLPLDYLHYTGIVHSDSEDRRREEFLKKISHLFTKLLNYAPVDGAADQMGAKFLREALPPCISGEEQSGLVCSSGAKWDGEKVVDSTVLRGDSMVRLFRRGVVRLVMERDATMLYSSVQNTRCPREKEITGMEIQDWEGPSMDFLIEMYPSFVAVNTLPMEEGTTQKRVALCDHLYQLGLLVTK